MTPGTAPDQGWHPASRQQVVGGLGCHYVHLRPAHRAHPPVVLVHGFLMSSFSWRHNLEALAGDREVIAPCLLGSGWSGIPDTGYELDGLSGFVLRLLDQLHVERADLVGHSLGGAVAVWMAHRAPERFRRLVLVNPLVLPSSVPPHPRWIHKKWMSPLLRGALRPTIARLGLQALAYRRTLVDSHYMAGFRAPLLRSRSLVSIRQMIAQMPRITHQTSGVLGAVGHPTLVLWGDRDPLLGSTGGPRISGLIPGARLVTLPTCGHCPHEERPERFNSLILRFLGQGEDVPRSP